MMSEEALRFLEECDYRNKTHAERMGLISLAKTLYPNEEDE